MGSGVGAAVFRGRAEVECPCQETIKERASPGRHPQLPSQNQTQEPRPKDLGLKGHNVIEWTGVPIPDISPSPPPHKEWPHSCRHNLPPKSSKKDATLPSRLFVRELRGHPYYEHEI